MTLDLEAIQSAIVTRLPVRARWTINGTPLDWDFANARAGLRELTKDMVFGSGEEEWFDLEEEWFELLIFGDYDYAEGGGAHPWLGVQKTNGAIYGLDLERENAMFVLNSSIDGFIRTFQFLNESLGKGSDLPLDLEVFLRNIDPETYSMSYWRFLVDYLAGGD